MRIKGHEAQDKSKDNMQLFGIVRLLGCKHLKLHMEICAGKILSTQFSVQRPIVCLNLNISSSIFE